ncbi:MAG TPA: hypothetical protein VGA99_03750 [bacterium]
MTKRNIATLFCMLFITCLLASALFAQAPQLINYQGRLNQGASPANGTFNIAFSIYSVASAGTAIYSETQSVNVSDGIFNVLIGSVTAIPTNLFTNAGDRFLGVKVGNDAEMTPRFRLASVAYAVRATESDGVTDGAIANADLANNAVTAGKIATAQVVKSVNTLKDDVTLAAGTNVTITPSGNTLTISASGGGSGAGNSLDAADGDPTNAVFVDNDGNVGVGTTTPFAKLDVVSESGAAGFYETLDETDLSTTLEVFNVGLGNGGFFTTDNPDNDVATLAVDNNGLASAVFANNTGTDVSSTAGFFQVSNTSSNGTALVGITTGLNGAGFFRTANTANAVTTLTAIHDASNGSAGFFQGNVTVTGFIFKQGGGFQIDHPLDPANKYLNHSFVESPDMMNIYNGNVTLDANGEATVDLPDWFDAINSDFRYQLTPIGAPGPNLYIAEKISNRRFRIAGGVSGGEVSWQVTGVRKDAFANAHRIPVEQTKSPKEQNYYLEPELFGQPESQAIKNTRSLPSIKEEPKSKARATRSQEKQ